MRLPDQDAKYDLWSVVIARALASPGDQTYTSGPLEPSSGMAEKASISPFVDQSGAEPRSGRCPGSKARSGRDGPAGGVRSGPSAVATGRRDPSARWSRRLVSASVTSGAGIAWPARSSARRIVLVAAPSCPSIDLGGIMTTAITSSPTLWPTMASWLPFGLSVTLPARMSSAGRMASARNSLFRRSRAGRWPDKPGSAPSGRRPCLTAPTPTKTIGWGGIVSGVGRRCDACRWADRRAPAAEPLPRPSRRSPRWPSSRLSTVVQTRGRGPGGDATSLRDKPVLPRDRGSTMSVPTGRAAGSARGDRVTDALRAVLVVDPEPDRTS